MPSTNGPTTTPTTTDATDSGGTVSGTGGATTTGPGTTGPGTTGNTSTTDPIWIANSIQGTVSKIDGDGDPWFGGCSGQVVTFDAKLEKFITVGAPGGCLRGLQVDQEGRGWIAKNGGGCLVQVDTIANTIVNPSIDLPGCSQTVGVSIDIEGFVWVVDQSAQLAFKVDPDTLQAQTVGGLVGPYTYSDMTGAGIRLQVLPQ